MNEEQMKYVANLMSQDLEKDKEIERLNNIIEKAIYCINLNQEKSGSLSYENCKRVKGILKGDEFHLRIFEEQVKELKEGKQ